MYRSTKTLLGDHFGLLLAACACFALLWNILLASPTVDVLSSGVVFWWALLCAASIFNICGWRISAASLARRRPDVDPSVCLFERRQLLLSAVYVIGCGFRAILPRADVQRINLYDSWASSVFVGRSVATVAELCFMIQWALLLHILCRDARFRPGMIIAWLLVPLIVIAETCSWYAVLTTSYLGNTIEESLWALCGTMILVSAFVLWYRGHTARRFLTAVIVLGVGYVAFMVTVDIPMYAWAGRSASGRLHLTVSEGLGRGNAGTTSYCTPGRRRS